MLNEKKMIDCLAEKKKRKEKKERKKKRKEKKTGYHSKAKITAIATKPNTDCMNEAELTDP